MSYLLVFLGGGLGSICRYAVARALPAYEWPVATLLANMLSCIVLGALVALAAREMVSLNYRLLLMTGFCGGFSTFSTFSYETLVFLREGDFGLAALYVGLSLFAGLICLLLGLKIAGV